MRRHVGQGWIGVWLLACLLPGCATRDSGYKISDETVAFVQPGVTSRSEVIENLGPPLFDLPDARVSAYSWGKVRSTGARPATSQERPPDARGGFAVGPAPREETGSVETQRWVFAIAWDENDRVDRVEKIKLEGPTSLERAVRQWAGSSR